MKYENIRKKLTVNLERELTDEEWETFLGQISAFQDAWEKFKKDVQDLIKGWVENFLAELMKCGNCRYWEKPKFGGGYSSQVAKCEIQGYLVHKNCHTCEYFNLDEGEFDEKKE